MGMTISDAELAAKVRELTDRAEIHECMMRYARGMDRRDREVLRSAYHDGAFDDHVDVVDHRGRDRHAGPGADPDQGPIRPVLPAPAGRVEPLNKYLGEWRTCSRA
jgi:SnoaL-like domain